MDSLGIGRPELRGMTTTMNNVTASTRARMTALRARIADLLDHEPSPDLAAVLESARDDLGRIERALDGM